MENIDNLKYYIGMIMGHTGVFYFIFRFVYFGIKNSFTNEFRKITKYEYFLLIPSTFGKTKTEKRIRKFINLLLKIVYITGVILIIVIFVQVVKKSINN